MSFPIYWFHSKILEDIANSPDPNEEYLRGISSNILLGTWESGEEIKDDFYQKVNLDKPKDLPDATNKLRNIVDNKLFLFPGQSDEYQKNNSKFFDESTTVDFRIKVIEDISEANFNNLRKIASIYSTKDLEAENLSDNLLSKNYKNVALQILQKDNIKKHNEFVESKGFNQFILEVEETQEKKEKTPPPKKESESKIQVTEFQLSESEKETLGKLYYGYLFCEYKLDTYREFLVERLREILDKKKERAFKELSSLPEKLLGKYEELQEINITEIKKYEIDPNDPEYKEITKLYEKIIAKKTSEISVNNKIDNDIFKDFSFMPELIHQSIYTNNTFDFV